MNKGRNLVLILAVTSAACAGNHPAFADSTSDTTTPSSDASAAAPQGEQAFLQSADAKWSKLINDGQTMLTSGKETPAIGMFKRAVSQVERTETADQIAKDKMTAISNKKLGQAYLKKADYVKADAQLKLAKAAYDKLSQKDEELATTVADLEKHYRTIEIATLGDTVTGLMKEAGVSKIAVFRQEEKDLVEFNLDQKYIKPVDSKDVPKISFNKKVSFVFFNKPNGDYQVSKIQGLQVYAKSLWVNLLESLVKVGEKPVAEVTAGKMGMTKTVTVDIPNDMYTSTKKILDNLISAIKGQPAYAADGSGSTSAASSGNSAGTSSASPNGNPNIEASGTQSGGTTATPANSGYSSQPSSLNSPSSSSSSSSSNSSTSGTSTPLSSPFATDNREESSNTVPPPSPDPQGFGN